MNRKEILAELKAMLGTYHCGCGYEDDIQDLIDTIEAN